MASLIDIKDKKLLYYLSENARMSHTQLAKQVGLSKNAIPYRIDRLKKLRIITKFATTLHFGAMQLETVGFLFKFNEDLYENAQILNFFKQHPFVDWVATLSGNWDLFAEFVSKDFNQLRQLTKEIIIQLGTLINSYEVFFSYSIIKVQHLPEHFYQGLELEALPVKKRETKQYTLDEKDKQILYILNQDASLSFIEIAKQLNLTLDIVRYRMKMLEQQNVILNYFPVVAVKHLGYNQYLLRIKLKNPLPEVIDKIKSTLKLHPHITYAFLDEISLHLIVVAAFTTSDEIDTFSRSLQKQYRDHIEKQEYILIKEQLLFTLFPVGLLNQQNP